MIFWIVTFFRRLNYIYLLPCNEYVHFLVKVTKKYQDKNKAKNWAYVSRFMSHTVVVFQIHLELLTKLI